MDPVWEDADGEEIVNETFTRLEKAFHAIFSERDAVASNLLRASVTSFDALYGLGFAASVAPTSVAKSSGLARVVFTTDGGNGKLQSALGGARRHRLRCGCLWVVSTIHLPGAR